MNEIVLSYDYDGNNVINDVIIFDPVKAGETTKKIIYAINTTEYVLDVFLNVIGNKLIELKDQEFKIGPNGKKEINFELSPALTTMQPINAQIEVKITYVVL